MIEPPVEPPPPPPGHADIERFPDPSDCQQPEASSYGRFQVVPLKEVPAGARRPTYCEVPTLVPAKAKLTMML